MTYLIICIELLLLISGTGIVLIYRFKCCDSSTLNYKRQYIESVHNSTNIGYLYLTYDESSRPLCYLVINDDVDLHKYKGGESVTLTIKTDSQE